MTLRITNIYRHTATNQREAALKDARCVFLRLSLIGQTSSVKWKTKNHKPPQDWVLGWSWKEKPPPPPPLHLHPACGTLMHPGSTCPPLSSLRSSVSIPNSGCSHVCLCAVISHPSIHPSIRRRSVVSGVCSHLFNACVRAVKVIKASPGTRSGSGSGSVSRWCCPLCPASRRTRSKWPGWTRPRTRRGNRRSPSPLSPRS